MATYSSMRFATALALLALAVSLVTAEALLREPTPAGRRLLQNPASSVSTATDPIAKDAESAKSRAAAAVAASDAKLSAAKAAMEVGGLMERGLARIAFAGIQTSNYKAKAAAVNATTLANDALDLLKKSQDQASLVATATTNLAVAEAKAIAATGITKTAALAAVDGARIALNIAKNAVASLAKGARQKATNALAAAAEAEMWASK